MEQKSGQQQGWANGDKAMVVVDLDCDKLIDANPAAEAAFGHSRPELIGRSLAKLLTSGRGVTTDTATTWCLAAESYGEKNRVLLHVARTEACQPTTEVRRLTWALQAYARSAKALIRSHSLDEMAQSACEAIVAFDNYALATIAMAELPPDLSVRLIASAGSAQDYVRGLNLSLDPNIPQGRGPVGRAMRTGQPWMMRDAEQDPDFATWRDRARRYGLRSNVTVPFRLGDEVVGAILVYAQSPDAFSETEVQIFHEIGEELAFAMSIIKDQERLDEARRAQIRAENQLKEQQSEMARIARALTLGEFASSVAHEITQPLAAVITNIETALRFMAVDGGNPEKARAALERSLRDADRAHQVIQQTRNFVTRDDSEGESCNIKELTNLVVDYVSGDLARADITVELNLAADLPPIIGRPIQLQQVLLNLIVNAKEALQVVTDRPRIIAIQSWMSDDGEIVLAVDDNGAGMTDDARQHVFEHFYTTKQGGMGLGLALSKSLIEAHGGFLRCTALHPNGTRFSCTLPVSEQKALRHGA